MSAAAMPAESRSKGASVAIIAICQVAAMALWFSASAIVPALVAEFKLSGFAQATLTTGVQVGFVLGCLASALLGLPDRVDPRRLFAAVGHRRRRRPTPCCWSSTSRLRSFHCCGSSPARAWPAYIRLA
jgi:hypothetical protein